MKRNLLSLGQSRWLRERFLPAGLILALTFAVYAPALRAGFVWDDDVSVTANPSLRTASGLLDLWFRPGVTVQYYPLAYSSFWVQYQLWGPDPLGYHLVNIALHGLGAVLLWLVLCRLGVRGAWLGAAIFAVHPVFVESVAWVSELKNVESGVLGLLCLLAWFRFSPPETSADRASKRRWGFYALALVLFAASLLAKSVVVTLPLVILVIIWFKRGRLRSSDLLAVAPMLVMSLAMGLMTIYSERHFSGAGGAAWDMSLFERMLVAGRALWFYVGKLIWPATLVSIYPRWEASAAGWWQPGFPLAVVAALVALWLLRARVGRGPLAAVACFVITVAPTLGFFKVSYHLYSFVADHFQYHAAPALIALLAAAIAGLGGGSRRRPLVVPLAGAALLLVLGVRTWTYAQVFRSEKTRCQQTVASNPGAWLALNNLGVALAQEGNFGDAIQRYQEALRIRPVYAEAHNNLGVALAGAGNDQEAIGHYREALRIWPTYAEAHNNLGAALARQGKVDDAVGEYREALGLKPDYVEARNNLGTALAFGGKVDEAIGQYEAVLRLRPDSAETHNDLGMALASAGRRDEAIGEFREALRISPDNAEAHNNLGSALAARGSAGEASAHFEAALRVRPSYPEALYNLGTALASQGRIEEATRRYQEALRQRPGYAEAHHNLGTALASTGRFDEAVAEYRAALRLKPDYAEAHGNLGMALVSGGNPREGMAELEEALRLRPEYAEAHHNLGLLLASDGKLEEAIGQFREALRIRPDDGAIHNSLGAGLASLGRLDEAVEQFERALQLDPNDQAARRNLDRVRALAAESHP